MFAKINQRKKTAGEPEPTSLSLLMSRRRRSMDRAHTSTAIGRALARAPLLERPVLAGFAGGAAPHVCPIAEEDCTGCIYRRCGPTRAPSLVIGSTMDLDSRHCREPLPSLNPLGRIEHHRRGTRATTAGSATCCRGSKPLLPTGVHWRGRHHHPPPLA